MTHGGAIRYCTLSGILPPQIRTAALFIPEIAANAESLPRAAPLRCAGAHCTAAPIAFPRRRSRLSVPFPLPTSGSDGRASFAPHGLGHDIRRWPAAMPAVCTQRRLRPRVVWRNSWITYNLVQVWAFGLDCFTTNYYLCAAPRPGAHVPRAACNVEAAAQRAEHAQGTRRARAEFT